jgi:hypothetical protein
LLLLLPKEHDKGLVAWVEPGVKPFSKIVRANRASTILLGALDGGCQQFMDFGRDGFCQFSSAAKSGLLDDGFHLASND